MEINQIGGAINQCVRRHCGTPKRLTACETTCYPKLYPAPMNTEVFVFEVWFLLPSLISPPNWFAPENRAQRFAAQRASGAGRFLVRMCRRSVFARRRASAKAAAGGTWPRRHLAAAGGGGWVSAEHLAAAVDPAPPPAAAVAHRSPRESLDPGRGPRRRRRRPGPRSPLLVE